jgi:hypothetical protein
MLSISLGDRLCLVVEEKKQGRNFPKVSQMVRELGHSWTHTMSDRNLLVSKSSNLYRFFFFNFILFWECPMSIRQALCN